MLYLPEGLAHGYQTLADDTEVFTRCPRRTRPITAPASAGTIPPSTSRGRCP
jgi:dTDP-4-dehydrorhamnose 3,5-epimerase-like enzyme